MLTFGSLFAGIGGFDLALERAGMRCAFQVEIDAACRSVLAKHWPDVPRYDDVRTVGRHNLPAVHVLCGGWPCQDLSVAGRRAGLAGQRSGLWWEFHRLVAELSPNWVLAENVPGLLSSWTPVDDPPSNLGRGRRWEVDERNDHATVVASLVDLGYGVAWRVLDAQHFGVPQRRRRVFLVGYRGEPWSAAASVLFEPESCSGDSAPSRTSGARAAATLESGANGTGGTRPPGSTVDTAETLVVSTLQGGGKRGHRLDVDTVAGGGLGRLMTGADDNDAQGNRLVVTALTSRAGNTQDDQQLGQLVYRKATKTHGGADPDAERWEQTEHADTLDASGMGALQATAVVAPIAGGNYGSGNTDEGVPNLVLEPTVRRLTPLECERLQGFPDGWTDGQSDSTRYRQLGNAVAVPVIEWIACRLVAVDEALSTRELAG